MLPSNTQEILKQAAVAAEVNYHHIDEMGVWWRTSHMSESVYCWNPLTKQGHTDKLAEFLGITSNVNKELGMGIATDKKGRVFRIEADICGHDLGAAQRRAVTFAAANNSL